MNKLTVFASAFAIGVVAGLRSMTAPALVAWQPCLKGKRQGDGSAVAPVFSALAVGELIADKLPMTPSRLERGPFAARVAIGGICGGILATRNQESPLGGAIAGALGAVAGSFGGYDARTGLVKALQVPDYMVALAEDCLAVGGGLVVITQLV